MMRTESSLARLIFGAFTDDDRTVPTNSDATRKGILTGLIGRQGAVGVFVSGTGANKDNYNGWDRHSDWLCWRVCRQPV